MPEPQGGWAGVSGIWSVNILTFRFLPGLSGLIILMWEKTLGILEDMDQPVVGVDLVEAQQRFFPVGFRSVHR